MTNKTYFYRDKVALRTTLKYNLWISAKTDLRQDEPIKRKNMFYVLKLFYNELIRLDRYFYQDSRTCNDPLMGAPWKMLSILGVYLMFVKVWGPRFMANRKPFNVKRYMLAYNVAQIVINIYIFYESIHYSYWQKDFNISCQPYNTNDRSPAMMLLRKPSIVYCLNKYMDILDTIFFILRKKTKQVSFLHVYHHAIMIVAGWIYHNLLFGSHMTLIGVLNSFVHIIMYTYYLITALEIQIDMAKWKHRLTQLQIVQFSIFTLHLLWPMLYNWCGINYGWVFTTSIQNAFMLCLFCDFYYKAYIKKGARNANTQHELQ